MSLDILITVAITSFIQSVFGVGVLLFGTPLLMLQGHDFFQSVIVLLPISLLINLFQVAKDHRGVDLDFYKKVLIYTVPFIVIFLFFVTEVTINIGLVIGVLLLFVALKDVYTRANSVVNFVIQYQKSYFIVMGIVHGLTNLGGSLLTAVVHGKGYEKRVTRVTVAASYATFAVFQMVTLVVAGLSIDTKLSEIGLYLAVGVLVFVATERLIYADINTETYRRFFAVFLFATGALLCAKSI